MKTRHTVFYYLTIWILLIFFTATSSLVIIFQTNIGKSKIKNLLIGYAQKNGIDLKIKEISGVLPFQYKLSDVDIKTKSENIQIEKLNFRIMFWPLLNKNLTFRSFEAQNIYFQSIEKNASISKEKNVSKDTPWISPKINITFHKIRLNKLHLTILNEP